MLSNALWELVAVSGRRGVGVTATVTAELRPNTAGSWVRVADGGGVSPATSTPRCRGTRRTSGFVSSVAREYVLSAGEAFSPPTISEIRDSPPTPSTVLDVVHRSGSARRMQTALVARFDDASTWRRTGTTLSALSTT